MSFRINYGFMVCLAIVLESYQSSLTLGLDLHKSLIRYIHKGKGRPRIRRHHTQVSPSQAGFASKGSTRQDLDPTGTSAVAFTDQ